MINLAILTEMDEAEPLVPRCNPGLSGFGLGAEPMSGAALALPPVFRSDYFARNAVFSTIVRASFICTNRRSTSGSAFKPCASSSSLPA
jgi:hypothetical protein